MNRTGKIKMLIEYDGKQHFGLGLFSSDEKEMLDLYNRTKQSDYSKNEYCFRNGIPLMRIPYNRYYKIEEILENAVNDGKLIIDKTISGVVYYLNELTTYEEIATEVEQQVTSE